MFEVVNAEPLMLIYMYMYEKKLCTSHRLYFRGCHSSRYCVVFFCGESGGQGQGMGPGPIECNGFARHRHHTAVKTLSLTSMSIIRISSASRDPYHHRSTRIGAVKASLKNTRIKRDRLHHVLT